VVERLNADPAPGELVAPDWAADKRGLLAAIAARLEADDIWQGCAWEGDGRKNASGGRGNDSPGPLNARPF